VVPPQPPRRRKKKLVERDYAEQVKRIKTALSRAGINYADLIDDNPDDVEDLEQGLNGLKTSPSSTADYASPGRGHDRQRFGPFAGASQSLDEALQNSSDDEYEGPTLDHAYDTVFPDDSGFPFVVGGSMASVASSHPSPTKIFQLWQKYIDNVEPLLKVIHVLTLQNQIINAMADTARIPRPLEALMFAIYYAAVTSMTDDEVRGYFDEDKTVLLSKYHMATQQALVNAGFLRSTELMVLQALLLYLLCIRRSVDPRSQFLLVGVAVRMANRLGLHQGGKDHDLTPFEREQRRRLWWQIVIHDKRLAEITGSELSALATCGGCAFPLNVNDSDLNIHAKEAPPPHQGPTEMLFSLTRIELTVATTPSSLRPMETSSGNVMQKPRVHYNPSASSQDVVSHVAQNLPCDLDSFCAYIENTYLKHCDHKIPLHYFTLLMTRQALCKLRIIDFMRRDNQESLGDAERLHFFEEAIRVVEIDNVIQTEPLVQRFKWYTEQHFPLPSFIFLVWELRRRTMGELCERAWNAILENHESRGFARNMRTPLHILLGSGIIKAWEARVAAESQIGRQLQTPSMVNMVRGILTRAKRTAPAPASAQTTAPGPGPASAPRPPIGGVSSGGIHTTGHRPPPAPAPAPMAGVASVAPQSEYKPLMTNTSPGMYNAVTRPPMQEPSPQLSNTSMMNDSIMLGGFDETNGQVFAESPVSGGMDGPMDWNQFVTFSSFGGFNPHYFLQHPGYPAMGGQ